MFDPTTGEPEERIRVRLPSGGEILLGGAPRVMGILNVTPDSFSDGGRFQDLEAAVARGVEMAGEGADIIDVGGESTRPGAPEVLPEEERDRVLAVIGALAKRISVPISIDTRRASTARAAIAAGARIINDISGLADPEMAPLAVSSGAPVILMHMRGTPADMRGRTDYGDVLTDVASELLERVRIARDAGLPRDRIILDPGIGFAKTASQSLELIRRLPELRALGYPVLVGPSRKSFLGSILESGPGERLFLTIGAVLACVERGADIVRVHDVRATVEAIRAYRACLG